MTLSSVFSSLFGALATVAGAHILAPVAFTQFGLLNLIVLTSANLLRGSVFQPALIHFRNDKRAILSPRLAATAISIATVACAAVDFAVLHQFSAGLMIAGVSTFLPMLHDWLRHRALSSDYRRTVALADAVRLLTLPAVILIPQHAPIDYFIAYMWASAPAILVLLPTYRRSRNYAPYRDYWPQARAQGLDYLLATLGQTLPLLALGAISSIPLIGSLRLGQTLLGPLNLVFTAIETSLIVNASTSDSLRQDAVLIRSGTRIARAIAAIATATVAILVAVALGLPASISKTPTQTLVIGIGLAGALQISGGWAGVHILVLRAIRAAREVAAARLAILMIIWLAHAVGYVLGGVEVSLITGTVTSAIIYPLAYAGVAKRAYLKVASAV